MNIGLIGLVNPTPQAGAGNLTSASNGSSSFASLLGSVFSGEQVEEVSNVKDSNLLLALTNLFSFLELEDLDELPGGNLLKAEAALTDDNDDLLKMIINFLQLDEKQFEKLIVNNSEALNLEQTEDPLQMLMQLFSQLTTVAQENVQSVLNDDVTVIAKASKLLQLLLNNQDTDERKQVLQNNLSKDLKQLAETIKSALQADKLAGRNNILQKVFATIVSEEVSQQNSETGQTKLSTEVGRTEGVMNQTFNLQHVPKAEQLTLMLESNGRQVNTEQLIKQFNSILSKSQFLKEGGTQRLFIKLHPEHLGALRIELIQKNQMMVARILTTTAMAREALDSQLNSLKQAFANQNIQVERVEVSQQMAQHDRFFQKDNDQQQNKNSQNNDNQNEQEHDESFGTTFEDALLNVEV